MYRWIDDRGFARIHSDNMVLLTMTPRIAAALRVHSTLTTTSPTAPPLDIADSAPAIAHRDLHALASALRAHDPANAASYSFSALLRGTGVYTPPPPPPPPRSPEYVALMARLRREQEEREYHALVAPAPTRTGDDDDEEEATWKEVRSQVSVIFNILLSTLATAAAVWKVAAGWDVPQRLAAAFVSALVVAVAEAVLFGGYVRRLGQARRRDAAHNETKAVVGVWEIGPAGVRQRVLGSEGEAG